MRGLEIGEEQSKGGLIGEKKLSREAAVRGKREEDTLKAESAVKEDVADELH